MSGRGRGHGREHGRGHGRKRGRGRRRGRRTPASGQRCGRRHVRSALVLAAALLTGCGPLGSASPDGPDRPAAHAEHPVGPAQRPVPHGAGSKVPYDFNGDGHPDLVVNDLLNRGGRAAHDDDPGIGIVYGSARGLVPRTRQLLTSSRNAAPTKGVVPAAFEAGAACDLDRDGFTDLVVTTDPPYDGVGRPPVPVQLLFGSPRGLAAGRAVPLHIPERARDGDEWPDQPVCGDFDGDGATDLAVTASGARISYLRGPFTRQGAPRAAAPLGVPGTALAALPGPLDADRDGADGLLVRTADPGTAATSRLALGGPQGPARAGTAFPAGHALAFGHFRHGTGTDAVVATGSRLLPRYGLTGDAPPLRVPGRALHAADVTADGYTDLVVSDTDPVSGTDRTARGTDPAASDAASAGSAPPAPAFLPGSATGLSGREARPLRQPALPGTGPLHTTVLALADYDGDGHADLVLLTHRAPAQDTSAHRTPTAAQDRITIHPGTPTGPSATPQVTFSTTAFTVFFTDG
ncbi:VCBS repeat-containing protein [Streptomyces paromomycinus]|uniref:Histidine kinase n=1 Tax=Streptomyces paromomycinus TaxID=92743 RepID=A0A401W5Q0_STREY|nr:VCBS repeat-containing protein [Streptomyces paromomycinus]GCD44619.1 histidine kinase [Streptomyces paromomycinus]